MTFALALRRLLPLLAVLSLALTPMVAPAAVAGMHAPMEHHGVALTAMDMAAMDMAAMDMPAMDMAMMDPDAMPCCPKAAAPVPDKPTPGCAKGCPLMALCLASVASLLPSGLPMPVPVGRRAGLTWPEPAGFASVQTTPYPEPPRA